MEDIGTALHELAQVTSVTYLQITYVTRSSLRMRCSTSLWSERVSPSRLVHMRVNTLTSCIIVFAQLHSNSTIRHLARA